MALIHIADGKKDSWNRWEFEVLNMVSVLKWLISEEESWPYWHSYGSTLACSP